MAAERTKCQPTKSWPVSPRLLLPQNLARDHHPLDFAGSLADGAQLHIAIELFCGVVLDKSISAVNLYGLIRYAHSHFARIKLRHAGFLRDARIVVPSADSAIREPRSLIRQQARRFDLCRHIGELELDRLKFRDGLAELLALLRVAHRSFVRALRHTQSQRSDRNPAAVQNLQAVDESFAFLAQQIFGRHLALREHHFARVTRAQTQLVFFFPGLESRRSLLDDERRNSV